MNSDIRFFSSCVPSSHHRGLNTIWTQGFVSIAENILKLSLLNKRIVDL